MSNQQFPAWEDKRLLGIVFEFSFGISGKPLISSFFFFFPAHVSLSVQGRKTPLSFIVDILNEEEKDKVKQQKTSHSGIQSFSSLELYSQYVSNIAVNVLMFVMA